MIEGLTLCFFTPLGLKCWSAHAPTDVAIEEERFSLLNHLTISFPELDNKQSLLIVAVLRGLGGPS